MDKPQEMNAAEGNVDGDGVSKPNGDRAGGSAHTCYEDPAISVWAKAVHTLFPLSESNSESISVDSFKFVC